MSEATLADFPIYDCDSHWTEPPDLWQSRAPASMRDAMPRVRDIDVSDDARRAILHDNAARLYGDAAA